MPKWSEILARLVPWLDLDGGETSRIREGIAAVEREQREMEPIIADQTAYLISRDRLNGFSEQLRMGFQRRAAEQ